MDPELQDYALSCYLAEYACIVRGVGKALRWDGKDVWTSQLQHLDYPATCVSMNDAKAYAYARGTCPPRGPEPCMYSIRLHAT